MDSFNGTTFLRENVLYRRHIEQIIGREGETATLLSLRLFNSELREFGFAPRHLSR